MSTDRTPTPMTDATDRSVYLNAGAKMQTDSAQAGNPPAAAPEKNAALENSGVLPKVTINERERWANAQSGGAGGDGKQGFEHHSHPGPGGHHGRGGHHGGRRPEEELAHNEIKNLPPDEKAKFKAEGKVAHEYRSEMATWRKDGKVGPEPTKPDIPEHDKVAAKVKADREAIETKVRANMSPQQLAAVDGAKAQYMSEVKAAGSRKGVAVPEELKDYERAMGHATRHYIRDEGKPA